ncbi:hypothetical protein IAT40_003710 [Kwoniella sp. CBS 6097]
MVTYNPQDGTDSSSLKPTGVGSGTSDGPLPRNPAISAAQQSQPPATTYAPQSSTPRPSASDVEQTLLTARDKWASPKPVFGASSFQASSTGRNSTSIQPGKSTAVIAVNANDVEPVVGEYVPFSRMTPTSTSTAPSLLSAPIPPKTSHPSMVRHKPANMFSSSSNGKTLPPRPPGSDMLSRIAEIPAGTFAATLALVTDLHSQCKTRPATQSSRVQATPSMRPNLNRKRQAESVPSPEKSKRQKVTASRPPHTVSTDIDKGKGKDKGKDKDKDTGARAAARIQPQVIDMTWLDDDEPVEFPIRDDLELEVKEERRDEHEGQTKTNGIPLKRNRSGSHVVANEVPKFPIARGPPANETEAVARILPPLSNLSAVELTAVTPSPVPARHPSIAPSQRSSRPPMVKSSIWDVFRTASGDLPKGVGRLFESDPEYVGSILWQARIKDITGQKGKDRSRIKSQKPALAKTPFLRRTILKTVSACLADVFPDLSLGNSSNLPLTTIPQKGGFKTFHEGRDQRQANIHTARTDRYIQFQFNRLVPVDPKSLRPIDVTSNSLMPDEMDMRLHLTDNTAERATLFQLSLSIEQLSFLSVTSRTHVKITDQMFTSSIEGSLQVKFKAEFRRDGLPVKNGLAEWTSHEQVIIHEDGGYASSLKHFYLQHDKASFLLRLDPPPKWVYDERRHRLRPLPRRLISETPRDPTCKLLVKYDGFIKAQLTKWACLLCKDDIVYGSDGELALHHAVMHRDVCWIEEKGPRERADGVEHVTLLLHEGRKPVPAPAPALQAVPVPVPAPSLPPSAISIVSIPPDRLRNADPSGTSSICSSVELCELQDDHLLPPPKGDLSVLTTPPTASGLDGVPPPASLFSPSSPLSSLPDASPWTTYADPKERHHQNTAAESTERARYTSTGLMEPSMVNRRNKWTTWSHRIEVGTVADFMPALDEVYTGGKFRHQMREHEETVLWTQHHMSPEKRFIMCCWNRWQHEKGPIPAVNNSSYFQSFIRAYANVMDRAGLTTEIGETLHIFFRERYLSFTDYAACMTLWKELSTVEERESAKRMSQEMTGGAHTSIDARVFATVGAKIAGLARADAE